MIKTTFRLFLFLFVLASCKTIRVRESSFFTPTKYNYEVFTNNLKTSPLSERQKELFSSAANKIVNTTEQQILNLGYANLTRGFLMINDSITLEYFVFEPKVIKKTGIYFEGNGTNVLSFADKLFELCAKANSKMYVLNYRGYGKSTGSPSFSTQFGDNSAFIRYVEKQENTRIDFVIGYSLGSVFATYAAVDHNIPTLYLLSPFSNAKQMMAHIKKVNTAGNKKVVRPFIKVAADPYLLALSNTKKITGYSGRLLIVHGKADKTLPYYMGQDIYSSYHSANKYFITLPGGHGAAFESEGWKQLIEQINN